MDTQRKLDQSEAQCEDIRRSHSGQMSQFTMNRQKNVLVADQGRGGDKGEGTNPISTDS